MQYEWAVEVTTQYLNDEGEPDGEPEVKVHREASGEYAARARLASVQRTIERGERGHHPRWGKVVGTRLLQRTVAPWVEVKP